MANEDKRKKKRKILIIIIILLILLILFLFGLWYLRRDYVKSEPLKMSATQTSAVNPILTNTSDDQYFELVGFGQLEINKDNPCINLINPSENSVYLSFDVIYNDESLFKTNLIEPGKMEQFNIYSCLNAGEHTITYSINVYDITNQKPLWTGIQQEQEIIVKR